MSDEIATETEQVAGPTDSGAATKARKRRRVRRWTIAGVLALLLGGVLAASLVYTEKSDFCESCHEMGPYYTAWESGPHAGHAACVDCHVDAGIWAHLKHKPTALKEVWDHFFSHNTYPTYAVEVPDSRCTGCHRSVPDKITSAGTMFSHDLHAKKAACKECHLSTGHDVTFDALRRAGVLRTGATTPTVAGMSPSASPGHVVVLCQDCHDQAKMPCSKCHVAPHGNRGECSDCHHTGEKWEPGHTSRTDCTACHTAPKPHYGTDCAGCHKASVPFAKTIYTHGASTACAGCHRAPSGHYGTSCKSCHSPSVPFAKTIYRHVSGSRCSACHHAPSGHFGSSCASCHSPSVPFKKTVYRHVSGSNCRSCHRPPSSHFTATCTTCHSPSVAFSKTKFTHTSNSNCAQCHHAPANHFGTVCSSCHKPSVPFANASFSHPRTHHNYRSIACAKCHPNNYTTAYCSCHNGHPPND